MKTSVKDANVLGPGDFVGLTQLMFLGLKLAGAIGWPWWLVFAPLWAAPAALIVLLLCLAAMSLIADRFAAPSKPGRSGSPDSGKIF